MPELAGCHTQAWSLASLMKRIREAILVCLEAQGGEAGKSEFVGVQRVAVES